MLRRDSEGTEQSARRANFESNHAIETVARYRYEKCREVVCDAFDWKTGFAKEAMDVREVALLGLSNHHLPLPSNGSALSGVEWRRRTAPSL